MLRIFCKAEFDSAKATFNSNLSIRLSSLASELAIDLELGDIDTLMVA